MTDAPSRTRAATARRLELAHTIGFIVHPGNAAVLAGRLLRSATGRQIAVEKPGRTITYEWIADQLAAATALDPALFDFIDEHRAWVVQEHSQHVLHATDRRHAEDQTVDERCVAVSLPEKDGRVLYQLAQHLRARHVIEIGTAFGVGTRYLAAGMQRHGDPVGLWTIEPDTVRQRIACHALGDFASFVKPCPGMAEDRMPDVTAQCREVDLVFIDALHTFDATWGYYELIRRLTRGRSFCVIHDVNSSWETARVWKKIVAQPATLEAGSWQRLGLCIVEGEHPQETSP
ncbi:MAG: O-methyltransferase [Planctomycetota bacterium]|jgi:predicted O-methyltransferase YrrM